MSARVWRRALSALLVTGAAYASTARAQDSILVRVGGDLSARQNQYLDVPVTVDLSGAPGRLLGGYSAVLRFDGVNLTTDSTQVTSTGFARPQVNGDSAAFGVLRLGALLPAGASGLVQLFTVRFYVSEDTMTNATFTLTFSAMTAALSSSVPFEDLTPLVRVVNGSFCRSLGKWGDVDGDGISGSRDALVALSYVVGLPVDTVTMQPRLADVDADGTVTSRDALIMLSYAVGLPITGYRVLLTAAGSCSTGAARSLAITPDTLVLVPGQAAAVTVTALDSAGRAVPATGLLWRSSDGAVATGVLGYRDDSVAARQVGTATLTAEIGPGVRDSLVVVVVPRRPNWIVDVARARNAVTQTGTSRFPFAFIGDAAGYAQDGDTVRVSSGVYFETISAQRSLVVIGDSLDRPVIDPRGADYYDGYSPALTLGTGGGDATLLHLVFRRGGAALYGYNNTARDLRFEDIQGAFALQLESTPDPLNSGPLPGSLGNAAASQIFVAGHLNDGIVVTQADSVKVWNDTIIGPTFANGCGEVVSTGIRVGAQFGTGQDAASVQIHDNLLAPEACVGISVSTPSAVTLIQRNRINPAGYAGIIGSTRSISLSHNVVRMVAPNQYNTTYGIRISNQSPIDTLRSTGDSVIGSQGYAYGLLLDNLGVSLIDSLTTDSIGTDTLFSGYAIQLSSGLHSLSNSRIRNTGYYGIWFNAGPGSALRSRHNRIERTAYSALYVPGEFPFVPDSVESVGDTILGTTYGGMFFDAVAVRVDSALVDSAGTFGAAVEIGGARRASVSNSTLSRSLVGVQVAADTLLIARNTVTRDSTGIRLLYPPTSAWDTALVYGNQVTGSLYNALEVGGHTTRADSNQILGSGAYGVLVYGQAAAIVTRTRVQGNGAGLYLQFDGAGLTVSGSTIMGDTLFGVSNGEGVTGAVVVDARNNYWGDPAGPRCNILVTGVDCSASVTGDSVTSARVDFSSYLASPPVTPAPPAGLRVLAASTSTAQLLSAARTRTATVPARARSVAPRTAAPRPVAQPGRQAVVQGPRFPPMYRKGSAPIPAAPPRTHAR